MRSNSMLAAFLNQNNQLNLNKYNNQKLLLLLLLTIPLLQLRPQIHSVEVEVPPPVTA